MKNTAFACCPMRAISLRVYLKTLNVTGSEEFLR